MRPLVFPAIGGEHGLWKTVEINLQVSITAMSERVFWPVFMRAFAIKDKWIAVNWGRGLR
jgi:hypothetical protein